MKVTEIMSRPVITVKPDTPLKHAAELLVRHGISALPVLSPRGTLVGIVSEADLVPMQTRPDPRTQATPLAASAGSVPRTVADVMTRRVVSVRVDSEVSEAARSMLEAGVKRVPVLSGRRVVGIVSRRDLVRVIARGDDSLRSELVDRLKEAGLGGPGTAVVVDAGVATIVIEDSAPERRLAESIALSVPGVLEIKFRSPQTSGRHG